MNTPSIPDFARRIFKVWEYQVSHGQLLVRSPKSPAIPEAPERTTNVDLVFLGVEYMALPRLLTGLTIDGATVQELSSLASLMGKAPREQDVRILSSGGRRFPIVASHLSISENDWDIFESPFEFRSQFRGTR